MSAVSRMTRGLRPMTRIRAGPLIAGASMIRPPPGINVGTANIIRVGRTNNWYRLGMPMDHLPSRTPARVKDHPTWLISRAFARSSGLLAAGFEAHGHGLRSYH